jgi:hypothetical protein
LIDVRAMGGGVDHDRVHARRPRDGQRAARGAAVGWRDRILPHLRLRPAPTIPQLRPSEATPASVDGARPPHGQEDRVPMIRWIATAAAAAVLSAGLVSLHPAAQAAPQSAPAAAPAVQQPAPAPDAVAPAQPTPSPNRKPHNAGNRPAADGNVMRGSDTFSLVAMLPWWRPDDSRPPGSDPGELESPVLTACDVWLGFPFATADAQSLTVRLSLAQHADELDLVANKFRITDPGELNEIDLTAPEEPQGGGGSWLRGLLALLGGAVAAFSAVRYLIA